MTNEELIAEIEALDHAATPGPWESHVTGADGLVKCLDGRTFLTGDIIYHKENAANATLIARYRTLAVEAARALKELEEDDNVRRFINAAKNYDKNDELARAMAWILQTAGDAASGDPAAAAILADAATAIVKDFEGKR